MTGDIINNEIIGEEAQINDSKNISVKGLNGVIVDETKNTITLKTEKGFKKIIKDQVMLTIKNQKIHGKLLSFRPEERIKITSKKIKTITRSVKKEWKK